MHGCVRGTTQTERPHPTAACLSARPAVEIDIFAVSIALGLSFSGSTQDQLENKQVRRYWYKSEETCKILGSGTRRMQTPKKFHRLQHKATSHADVKTGAAFYFTTTGCPSTVLSAECYTRKFGTVCGALLTVGGSQWLYAKAGRSAKVKGMETLLPRYQHDRVPIRTGKNTLSVVRRYIAHLTFLSNIGALNWLCIKLHRTALCKYEKGLSLNLRYQWAGLMAVSGYNM